MAAPPAPAQQAKAGDGRAAAPVTREKSQFSAQHDSPSLNPVHDGIQPLSNFRALAAPFLWGGLFSPQHSRPDDSHRERRIASLIVSALAAAKK